MINAIKFSIEEIEASDQYFDHTGAGINVVVRNGNLELSGVVFDERQRQALKVAAENVPGVNAVHDHIAWVEPVSGMVFESPEDIAARSEIK